MFTPIGFFAPSGFTFGGVAGATFAYEAESTTAQGVWTDTTGNGNTGVESAETNTGITHNTDAGGNYWFLGNTNYSNYYTNYVSTNVQLGAVSSFSFCCIQQWGTPPFSPDNNNTGPLFVVSTVNNYLDMLFWVGTSTTNTNWKPIIILENSEKEPASLLNQGSNMRDKWWMISGVWSGTNWKVYLNTVEKYSVAFSPTLNCGTEPMDLHRFGRGAGNRGGRPVQDLQLGALVFYKDKALTAGEIATNYAYFQNYYTGL
jgi:hypothetical protein